MTLVKNKIKKLIIRVSRSNFFLDISCWLVLALSLKNRFTNSHGQSLVGFKSIFTDHLIIRRH